MIDKEIKDKRVNLRITNKELQRIDKLAATLGLDRTQLIMACVRLSAGAVRKKYIKAFVDEAQALPDPFEPEPSYMSQLKMDIKTVDQSDYDLAMLSLCVYCKMKDRTVGAYCSLTCMEAAHGVKEAVEEVSDALHK